VFSLRSATNRYKENDMKITSSSFKYAMGLAFITAMAIPAAAQDSTTSSDSSGDPMDEIIVSGSTVWESHDGLEAFRNGDFEKAEIEFEKEFKSLRRAKSGQENAAIAADIGFDRAQAIGQASVGGGGSGGPGGGPPPQATNVNAPDTGINGNFNSRRSKGQTVLNDGRVTQEDFAFSRYMAGLSEIKLGKYAEAKKSLKSSLSFDKKNYDARMRLGLLYVLENDFDKAADQLESLEKQRSKCKAKSCDEYDAILTSAKTLAKGITDKLNIQ